MALTLQVMDGSKTHNLRDRGNWDMWKAKIPEAWEGTAGIAWQWRTFVEKVRRRSEARARHYREEHRAQFPQCNVAGNRFWKGCEGTKYMWWGIGIWNTAHWGQTSAAEGFGLGVTVCSTFHRLSVLTTPPPPIPSLCFKLLQCCLSSFFFPKAWNAMPAMNTVFFWHFHSLIMLQASLEF